MSHSVGESEILDTRNCGYVLTSKARVDRGGGTWLQPVTTSLKVAEYSGKAHGKVLRTIETTGCSVGFNQASFDPAASVPPKKRWGTGSPSRSPGNIGCSHCSPVPPFFEISYTLDDGQSHGAYLVELLLRLPRYSPRSPI